MNNLPKSLFIKIFICILITGFSLYAYIFKHNELTELRLAIPSMTKNIRRIQEENNRLKYEIDSFESPIHLMEIMNMPEFCSLNFGYSQDVIILPLPNPIPGKDFSDLKPDLLPINGSERNCHDF